MKIVRRKYNIFEQMELELVNATKVSEIRQQHDKQLIKLRQQFEDGMKELISRCDNRIESLQNELELRRKVEIHEVEERKNQHIIPGSVKNDLSTILQKLFYIFPDLCDKRY
jgi:hypothetical protein